MTVQAMSPIRRRMIKDMTIRKCAPKTHLTICRGSRTSRSILVARLTRQVSRTYGATNFT